MSEEDLEKRTTASGDDGVQNIIRSFIDQPKSGPLPLRTLAKPYGPDAERFAKDLMDAYERGVVRTSSVPSQHPEYEFQPGAAHKGRVV